MKNMGRGLLALLLGAVLLLSGCGGPSEGTDRDYALGQKVSTHWFDFRVEEAQTADSCDGYPAPEGTRLAICTISLENTFDEAVPMGRGDFVLVWETDEDVVSDHGITGAYAMERYSVKQLPDEYTLEREESRSGTLVFVVPDGVERAAVRFQEYYAEGEQGSGYTPGERYQVWFDL